MPPQISEDEGSGSEANYPVKEDKPVAVRKGRGRRDEIAETQELLNVESEKEESEDDDDDEAGPDEYVVEAIVNHTIDDETGEILYEVKWEGYEKKSDRTFEPESNLETAPAILEAYLTKIGGKEALVEAWAEKKAKLKNKKRGRASTGNNDSTTKKSRKNGTTNLSASPPAGIKSIEFKPPTGSWEEDVTLIDACEGEDGKVIVFLTWKGGEKTQHPLPQVYKRCPQKMLKFYESHLVFKKNEDPKEE